MKHLGDYDASAVIYGKFTTYRPSTGAAFTLAGTPALSVYKDNSTTQSTTGVTLTADFDSVTGLNHFAIDTSADGTFYAAGSNFDIVITTGTVDGVSVVGSVVASFTIRKGSSLKPTTAGRTLDVSAGGEAGLDWANIGSPTTVVGLSGTTVKSATDVETDTQDIQSRLPAALVSGRIDASVGAMAANVMTAAAAAADLTTELQSGLATASALSTVDTNVSAIKAKTDNLPSDPADASDIAAAFGTVNSTLSTIAGYVDTEVSAIKSKTDQLTFTIANQVDVNVVDWKGSTAPAMTGDAFARLGAPAGASVSADIAAVKTDTGSIKTTTDKLDDTFEASSDGYIFTANALDNAPSSGGSAPTAVEIADEVQTRTIAAVTVVNGLASGAVDAIFDEAVDGTVTARQSIRLSNSVLGGKASGLETTEATFRDLADTKDRVVATVDADGNRTAVTRDLT